MFCGKCGANLVEGNTYCSVCGAAIGRVNAPTKEEAPSVVRRGPEAATIGLALLALGAGFGLYVLSASNYDMCQSVIGTVGQAMSSGTAVVCDNTRVMHYGGIAVMVLGAMLFLVGLVGQKRGSRE